MTNISTIELLFDNIFLVINKFWIDNVQVFVNIKIITEPFENEAHNLLNIILSKNKIIYKNPWQKRIM